MGAGAWGLRPGRTADGPHGNGQRDPRALGGTGLRGVHREAERIRPQRRHGDPKRPSGPDPRKSDADTIIDVKTGKPSPAHVVQVLLYMYAVPRAMGQHRDLVFDGQVAYADHVVDIPASAIDDRFIERLSQLVRRLASDAPARRVPSPSECRFCPITAADCPGRVAEEGLGQEVTTTPSGISSTASGSTTSHRDVSPPTPPGWRSR